MSGNIFQKSTWKLDLCECYVESTFRASNVKCAETFFLKFNKKKESQNRCKKRHILCCFKKNISKFQIFMRKKKKTLTSDPFFQ